MSDVITMTAEQLRARDMQVAEATESKLILGGYIALTKAQIADVVASVGGPQVQAAPVTVPEALQLDVFSNSHDEGYVNGWNACRAELLTTTPVQPAVAEPDVQIELALFAENQKRLEVEQQRDQLLAALKELAGSFDQETQFTELTRARLAIDATTQAVEGGAA